MFADFLTCGPRRRTALFCSAALLTLTAQAETLNVPNDFSTIQRAIDAASSGDVVEVETGTYEVNLQLRSDIEVRGLEAARTILIPDDLSLPVVEAVSVNNTLFANFTLGDSSGDTETTDAINIVESTEIIIANNIFDSVDGVALRVSILSEVEVVNNVFQSNGIAIERSTADVSVVNNLFVDNLVTIASSIGIPIDPGLNLNYNGFWQNDDVETALGENFQTGDPLFAAPDDGDYHLQEDSNGIDTGDDDLTDIIDDTTADLGAYGGEYADALPFPVARPSASDSSTSDPDVYNIDLSWDANLAYLITNDSNPGGYKVWYSLNESGPDYEGTDAGDGTLPSPIDVGDVTEYTLPDLQPDSSPAPGVPVLQSADPQNESVVLDWNSATDATGYEVRYGVNDALDESIDVGDTTSYTVTGLTNGTEYSFAVQALFQPRYYLAVTAYDNTQDQNESDFSAERSIAIGDPVEGELSNILQATPDPIEPYPDLPDDGGCFIATAAYGADWVAELQVLRAFRDQYLLTNVPGRHFVAWYYRHGPSAAAMLDQNPVFKPPVRALLTPLVLFAAFLLGASALVKFVSLALTVLLVAFCMRTWRTGVILKGVGI